MPSSDAPHLLYVEDEAMVAMVVTLALEEAGYKVTHVFSGKDALAAIDDDDVVKTYSVLITDVRLPEVDGWSIARYARKVRGTLPVIYVSGDSAIDWSSQGVPGSLMLQKPFANEALLATVSQVLA